MSITLSGWTEFIEKTETVPIKLMGEVDAELGDSAETWALLAKQQAPADQSVPGIRGGISASRLKDLEWEVVSSSDHSAYMEWGTKSRAKVPIELAVYASQFRGSGNGGGDAKAAIFRWAKRKGIPKDKWYPVFISIMTYGVNPHPFFFMHEKGIEVGLIERLKKLLREGR